MSKKDKIILIVLGILCLIICLSSIWVNNYLYFTPRQGSGLVEGI